MPAIHFTAVTSLFSGVVALSCYLAAAVPHWFFLEPTSIRYGPGSVCNGNTCQTNPYFNTRTVGTCTLRGSDWKDRDTASTAFLWIGVVLLAVVAVTVWLAWFKIHDLVGTCKLIVLKIFMAGAFASLMVSLAIFGGTMMSWLGCGQSVCANIPAPFECGYGASVICLIIALILCVVVGVVFIVLNFCELSVAVHRPGITFWTGILLIATLAFAIIAGASSRWLVITQSPSSLGLFATCTTAQSPTCQDNNYNGQVGILPTCLQPGSTKQDRDRAVAALLIMAGIGATVMCVVYALKFFGVVSFFFGTAMKIIAMCLFGFILFLICCGLIIFASTYNSWLTCGRDFCGIFDTFLTGTNCNYGFSFAAALFAVILTVVIIVLLLLEFFRCCNLCGRLEYYSSDPARDGTHSTHSTVVHSSHTTTTTTTVVKTRGPPPGDWVFDRESGYWFSEQRGLYYDEPSDQLFDPRTGQWYPR